MNQAADAAEASGDLNGCDGGRDDDGDDDSDDDSFNDDDDDDDDVDTLTDAGAAVAVLAFAVIIESGAFARFACTLGHASSVSRLMSA